jgi:hypothetical protein
MKAYTYLEARQRFADVARQAKREGQAQIRRRDGELFLVEPAPRSTWPLDVPGVGSGLTGRQVVDLVRASRRSTERLFSQASVDMGTQSTRAKRAASRRSGRARG